VYVYVGVFNVSGVGLLCSSKVVGRILNRE